MQTNQDIKTAKNPLWIYGEKPYHYALKDAVRDAVDAGLYGYALDLEFHAFLIDGQVRYEPRSFSFKRHCRNP